MSLAPHELLWLSLLGGWVAADATSFGQFMVSRPFVAATLAGVIVGNPVAGATVGVVLEAFHLTVLPVGAARYPEAGPPAVAAGAVYAAGSGSASVLLMVVGFALVWEWLSGHTLHQLRQYNVGFVAVRLAARPDQLERRHLAAIGLDLLRGTALVAVGALVLDAGVGILAPLWGLDERVTRVVVVGMLSGLIASSFRLFGGRLPWFAFGLAGGAAFAIFAR